ncbi:MAG: anthranilate synthase component I [Legionellales bacterium]|nr:anthranilate synthase component I [Legionellales bacterium]
MTLAQFQQFVQQGYQRIPVVHTVLADLETPLTCYLKLANRPNSYLLESVQGGEQWSRYSIIGLPCRTTIEVSDHQVVVRRDGDVAEQHKVADPLRWIEEFHQRLKVPPLPDVPRFYGGLVGYFGYDTVRYVEDKIAHCPLPDELNTPTIYLMVSDEVLVFDNLTGSLHLIVHTDPSVDNAYTRAHERIAEITQQLQAPTPTHFTAPQESATKTQWVFHQTEDMFKQNVARIKQYIAAGDVMQVVYSLRCSQQYTAEPIALYRAVRHLNPSPYLYYLNFADFQIVGSSPEILVRVEDNIMTLKPIAGTRHRGETAAADELLAQELLADPKELAEHLMLIDLGRNDIGRVCQIGSVQVAQQMQIEKYSHVMHIVSQINGHLVEDQPVLAPLRAALPAGTLSGAPKVRAMQIIDELEPCQRGIYGGAVGYLAGSGNMDTAIAIRTAIIKDGRMIVQAGAGIVHDSVPELEWQECLNKAKVFLHALAMVEQGF